MPRKQHSVRGKNALIASVLLFLGIIALYVCIFWQSQPRPLRTMNATIEESSDISDFASARRPSFNDFVRLDSCQRYILKDLQDLNVFERYHADIKPAYTAQIIRAGRSLATFLKTLQVQQETDQYTVFLIGSLADEWLPRYERDNTWAYRTSYDRALAVYKLWLKNDMDIRSYGVKIAIQGNGYHPFCAMPNQKNQSFAIQLQVNSSGSANQ